MSYAGQSTNYLRQRRHREKLKAAASDGDRLSEIENRVYRAAMVAARDGRVPSWIASHDDKRATVGKLCDWLNGQSTLLQLLGDEDEVKV